MKLNELAEKQREYLLQQVPEDEADGSRYDVQDHLPFGF